MPGLQSFCLCTAIALAIIYILQLTWFTAWLVIDQRRKEEGRDGLLLCVVHQEDYKPSGWKLASPEIQEKCWSVYERVTMSCFYKTVVLTLSSGLLAVGILGWTRMVHKFDPYLLLPDDSYLVNWADLQQQYYPGRGWSAHLYSGPILHTDLDTIDDMVTGLQHVYEGGHVIRDYDCWWSQFQIHVSKTWNYTHHRQYNDHQQFQKLLSEFLFSQEGAKYIKDFKFSSELKCGEPAPNITASKCEVEYYNFRGLDEHIPAKAAVSDAVTSAESPYLFSHSEIYSGWETDEIIGQELTRNLLLSILCVAIITTLLLGNIFVVILVLTMVVATLVDIVGFLHFWNVTIDIISAINIVLAIGLCVDYSVHIAHAYLASKGTRQQRTMKAMKMIGMAILNGGITTFLALSFCGLSSANVFVTFFKVKANYFLI